MVPFHTKKLLTTLRVNSPSFSGRIVPLFDTTLIQRGEGSRTATEPHHTPSQEAQPSSHTHISSPSIPTVTSVPTIPIPTVIPSETTPIKQYTRRARIAQSSALPPIADEPASLDRVTIAKSSTLPYDSAPRVTSHAAEEGSMPQSINKLTALCTSLQRHHLELLVQFQAQEVEINRLKERVKISEDKEGVIGARSEDDAPIKGRRIDEKEVATKRLRNDTEEVRLDEEEVPTGSGSIPTARPPATEVPTGSDMVPTAKLINELVKYQDHHSKILQYQAQQKKPKTTKQKRDFYIAVIRNNLGWKANDFKGMSFEEVEAKFKTVWEQIEGGVSKISEGEAAWLKRKGIRSEQESARKQKISEEVPEEVKSSDEVPDEKIKEMMQLVPIEEVYVEALQVKHPIIDWESLVKETLSKRSATSDKEMELWVELSRLYEPDVEDQLWTHTQNFMYAPAVWKLYDKCGVHQLTSKDKDIFMLVEKDYP
nr:hypothetical protein [Tanacetum cinerariifolium]